MYGDITRDTFPYAKETHISRVLMQQGRVLLDADWNLQVAVFWRYMRALAADLIGPHGGNGFQIRPNDPVDNDFRIGSGHYYVDGLLCENEPGYTFRTSQSSSQDYRTRLATGLYVAYLNVWERQGQDDYFREKALNGVDTTTRVQVVWRVDTILLEDVHKLGRQEIDRLEEKAKELSEKLAAATDEKEKPALRKQLDEVNMQLEELQTAFNADQAEVDKMVSMAVLHQKLVAGPKSRLRARIDPNIGSEDPCILPPSSRYRGSENQLYRVEIHGGGEAGEATFKWSRDNGAVSTAWLGISEGALLVENVRGFEDGQWVELTHDDVNVDGTLGTLIKIVKVEDDRLIFDPAGNTPEFRNDYEHPLVRRWDQANNDQISLEDGAIPLDKGLPSNWIDLENGIQVQFEKDENYRYQPGDYWLIPARTIGGQIEWPNNGSPNGLFQPPHGVVHDYAPLARITVDGNGNVTSADDLRRIITPVAK
jgi:ribosomal protein S20